MTVLETENLTHYYENGMAGAVAAIENINVKFEKGEIVGIIGHTGSGKSTSSASQRTSEARFRQSSALR